MRQYIRFILLLFTLFLPAASCTEGTESLDGVTVTAYPGAPATGVDLRAGRTFVCKTDADGYSCIRLDDGTNCVVSDNPWKSDGCTEPTAAAYYDYFFGDTRDSNMYFFNK